MRHNETDGRQPKKYKLFFVYNVILWEAGVGSFPRPRECTTGQVSGHSSLESGGRPPLKRLTKKAAHVYCKDPNPLARRRENYGCGEVTMAVVVRPGIKIINIADLRAEPMDKEYKFIQGALAEDEVFGRFVVEVDDTDRNLLICNLSDRKDTGYIELEKGLEPTIQQRNITALELWRFQYAFVTVRGKERVVLSEIRLKDIQEILEYCEEKGIDLDNLFSTILST